MTLEEVRDLAMDLRGTTESPHHRYTSFRVRGRIYATAPTEGGFLHVFVDEQDRERMIRIDLGTYQTLGWGKKVVGLRVDLGHATREDVQALLSAAWQRKLPKRA
ncbi:MAG: MmcQ/YjbR family DNA-binding protein [Gammaproteobacteria bacterium]|nr:MmcQ/YjbR family DNA-binding protein [Gammaproteobacteria bacterium]